MPQAKKPELLGDGPVDQQYIAVAKMIDTFLNGPRPRLEPSKNGFILMIFPFEGREGRCNYMSNAERKDVIVLLREQLARFEGMPSGEGHG